MANPAKVVETPLDIVVRMIRSPEFRNAGRDLHAEFPAFSASMRKSRHPEALTFYSEPEYAEKGARLFKVPGFDAGYALSGDGDIISVHNNAMYEGAPVRGVAPYLIEDARARGGNHLDHYGYPRLDQVYGGAGMKVYGQQPFNIEYAPPTWNVDVHGAPDVKWRGTPEFITEFCADPANDWTCNDIPAELVEGVMKRRREKFGK